MLGLADADAPERTLDITHMGAVEHSGAPRLRLFGALNLDRRRLCLGGLLAA
jgi:hypothetical protein